LATTSSNKMPLLVDRPLHSYATLGSGAALSTAANFNSVVADGCNLVIDCSSNDGAVIDSMSIFSTQAALTASNVLVFLSVASSKSSITSLNTVCVASGVIGTSLGERVNISLPALCVPVPNLASPAATVAAYPDEATKKNTGLYVPSGAAIYVGLDAAITSPADGVVHVFAQGGFF